MFYGQNRLALFYALMTISLATPLLDTVFRARRFSWRPA
jgi:hypothetical protein